MEHTFKIDSSPLCGHADQSYPQGNILHKYVILVTIKQGKNLLWCLFVTDDVALQASGA